MHTKIHIFDFSTVDLIVFFTLEANLKLLDECEIMLLLTVGISTYDVISNTEFLKSLSEI